MVIYVFSILLPKLYQTALFFFLPFGWKMTGLYRHAKRNPIRSKKAIIINFLLVALICAALRNSKFPFTATDKDEAGQLADTPNAFSAGCIQNALNSGPIVHGFITKSGPLDIRNWHENYTEWRESQFWKWIRHTTIHPYSSERVSVSHAQVLPKNPPLFPYCRIFINHRYKFIYLRAPKTGSTSLIQLLGNCGSPENGADKPTCLTPLQVESQEQYEQLWKDYLVFGFARNPWQRGVSSYRMLVRHMKNFTECSESARWSGFCEDPLSMGRIHAQYPQCTAHEGQGAPFAYHHVLEQAPCLLAPDGGWAADFIGRVEEFDEDIIELLNELEVRRQRDAPDDPPLQPPEKAPNANGKGCIEVAGPGALVAEEQYCKIDEYFTPDKYPRCFAQLAHYYQKDLLALGFSNCTI